MEFIFPGNNQNRKGENEGNSTDDGLEDRFMMSLASWWRFPTSVL